MTAEVADPADTDDAVSALIADQHAGVERLIALHVNRLGRGPHGLSPDQLAEVSAATVRILRRLFLDAVPRSGLSDSTCAVLKDLVVALPVEE